MKVGRKRPTATVRETGERKTHSSNPTTYLPGKRVWWFIPASQLGHTQKFCEPILQSWELEISLGL